MRGAAESIHDAAVCRRVRRRSAVLMLSWSTAELLAQWPGVGGLNRYLPLAASGLQSITVTAGAIGLWAVGRGLRRGQRGSLLAAMGALVGAGLFLLVGRPTFAGMAPLGAALLLLRARRWFSADADLHSARSGFIVAAVGIPAAMALDSFEGPGVHLATALLGATGAAVAGFLMTRPPAPALSVAVPHDVSTMRARRVIDKYGSDPLAYFALRDDKSLFFHGESVVAYAVVRGVCIVSPDPIGPVYERAEVWGAFREEMDAHGWLVGVLGAGEDWLPIYGEAGMRTLYIGDEAVVHCPSFSLAGRRLKSLRQAVQRAARRGHTVEIYDPQEVPPALRIKLLRLVAKGRQGNHERGFSMTLGRLFDPGDVGLLLAVCVDVHGEPVACCQFVPTSNGYCLDLMRRDPEACHGVVDLTLVRVIEALGDSGVESLGLNFSAWRAVLAGERPDSLRERLFRRSLLMLSDTFQIESLWQFNRKYDPGWIPRYATYSAIEDLPSCVLAVAKAESYWELPLIGRFMLPSVEASWVDIGRDVVHEAGLRRAVVHELPTADQA